MRIFLAAGFAFGERLAALTVFLAGLAVFFFGDRAAVDFLIDFFFAPDFLLIAISLAPRSEHPAWHTMSSPRMP
jgi:hypothetical protein